MKKGFFLLLFTLGVVLIKAQEVHFVFIQTQNKQPFYVRYEKEILSSTEIGYVVIPKVATDSIEITIGFPKKYGSGIKYKLEVKGKDRGFVIKQLDSALWALYEMEHMIMVMPVEVPIKNQTIIQPSSDPFTMLLAQVMNTPAIAQKITINDSLLAVDDYYQQVLKFSPGSRISDSILLVDKSLDTPILLTKNQDAFLRKGYGVMDSSGYFVGYIIKEENNFDTINIFIPTDTLLGNKKRALATETDILKMKAEWVLMDSGQFVFNVIKEKLDSFYFTVHQIKSLSIALRTEESKLMVYKLAFPQIIDKFYFSILQESLIKEENIIQFQKMFVNN